MNFATYADSYIHLCNDRISNEDGQRQGRAAAEILSRLGRQPGVILADEVGMGKTFVALAVAMSILLERSYSGPIVVMSPPSLREKWPNDWKVFKQKCLEQTKADQFRAASANSGVDFLRLLDDPADRRCHLIFLTHGALHRSMRDGFVKLALIKRAFKGRSSLVSQRRSFSRFAGKLLGLDYVERHASGLLGMLLDRPYDSWLKVIYRADKRLKETVVDDPVPKHLAEVLESMKGNEFEEVIEGLRQLPLRESPYLEDRLKDARQGIANSMDRVWKTALRRAEFRSPLLILDEAHHVKNPATRLASLFATDDSVKDSEFFRTAGPLGSKFERMLFLTATPFQLGHVELIRVLDRFEGINWKGSATPDLTQDGYKAELKHLGNVLDDAQSAALRLDRSWGRLVPEHITDDDGKTLDVDKWWEHAHAQQGDGIVAQVAEQVHRTKQAMDVAEQSLYPWVLRYNKPSHLPDEPDVPRRILLTGAAIQEGGNPDSGLEIGGSVLLPFLLAGRAQVLLAASTKGRALFAEGLASSFEAYFETRKGRDIREDDDTYEHEVETSPELEWYLKHLDRELSTKSQDVRAAHPKIRATAERAVDLWRRGEKVLIFCHYRATGRALRQHISGLLQHEIMQLGRDKLAGSSDRDVRARLDHLGEQFLKDGPLRVVVTSWLQRIVNGFGELSDRHADKVVEVVRRFVRTPSFLVRYMPLDARDTSAAFIAAVDEAGDGHASLRENVEHFCRFLVERSTEREEFLAALDKIQTGTHFGKEVRSVFDPAEIAGDSADGRTMLLPNVRLANGEVSSETRRRLLLTFNTPLFPEILIASSVMAEGVDLQLNCRYVIHHDLSWNPSILEQRSGRVDRIGSKAERVKKSINIFMPYVAATQDEKMFRVVQDRERWFQIIMGEKYKDDEASTDRQAAKIPLPLIVQQQLSMRLHP